MSVTLTRHRGLLVLALGGLVAALLLTVAAPGEARPSVIQADNVIGSYKVKRDGTLAGAIAVFGNPSSIRRKGQLGSTCNVRWKRIGVRMTFANFGAANPCDPDQGRFVRARTTGKDWRTESGLKIRNTSTRVAQRHPNATFRGRTSPNGLWWLVARPDPFLEPAGTLSPRLVAQVKQGRVVRFVVKFQAAGD